MCWVSFCSCLQHQNSQGCLGMEMSSSKQLNTSYTNSSGLVLKIWKNTVRVFMTHKCCWHSILQQEIYVQAMLLWFETSRISVKETTTILNCLNKNTTSMPHLVPTAEFAECGLLWGEVCSTKFIHRDNMQRVSKM